MLTIDGKGGECFLLLLIFLLQHTKFHHIEMFFYKSKDFMDYQTTSVHNEQQ
jgi:hypothetical protein